MRYALTAHCLDENDTLMGLDQVAVVWAKFRSRLAEDSTQ